MVGAAAALTVAGDGTRGRGGKGQPDGGDDPRVGEVGRDMLAALVARPAGAVQPQHEAAGRGALRCCRHGRRLLHWLVGASESGRGFGGRELGGVPPGISPLCRRTDQNRPAIADQRIVSSPWWRVALAWKVPPAR